MTAVIFFVNDMPDDSYSNGTVEVRDVRMRNYISRKLKVKRCTRIKWEIVAPEYDSHSEEFQAAIRAKEWDCPRSSSDEDELPTEKLFRPMKRMRRVLEAFEEDDDELKPVF